MVNMNIQVDKSGVLSYKIKTRKTRMAEKKPEKIDPAEEEKILEDDVLIARGAPHGVDDLKRLAEGKISELTGRSEKT